MNCIRISPGEENRLVVHLPYTPERIAKIKTIPGRRWHGPEKYWSVPKTADMPKLLLTLFAGESVELDPALSGGKGEPPKEILARVREAARTRHLSPDTEKAYAGWIRRFIEQAGPPENLGEAEIGRFLTSLAQDARVSASTQNQALAALLFLYKQVLSKEIGMVEGVVRAKRPHRLPVVLSKQEVRQVLANLDGTPRLMATLLYGAGLRLLECCRLRVKDIDFSQNQVVVRAGKGGKDRYTMLPANLQDTLRRHLEEVRELHEEDLKRGLGAVALPDALSRKYPNAPKEWGWQWFFPPPRTTPIPEPASAAATISTNRCSNEPSRMLGSRPASPNRPAAIPCAIPSPPTSWKTATTSAPSKSF